MQKAFDAMMAKMPKGTELKGAAADAAMMMKFLGDEAFAGAAAAASGLAKALKDLEDTANLSQSVLDAMNTSMNTLYEQAFNAAKGQGANDEQAQRAALMAILPLLEQLAHAKALGAKLTPEEEKLLKEAQQAGILPLKTVAEAQLGVQQQIRDG